MCLAKNLVRDLGWRTESAIVCTVCMSILLSLCFGNRWRCGKFFGIEHATAFGREGGSEDPDENFVTHLRGYSGDSDLVMALVCVCAYFSFYTPLRFNAKIVIDTFIVGSYSLTTLFVGSPP